MPHTTNAAQAAWLLGLSASDSITWLVPSRMAAMTAANDPATARARKNVPSTASVAHAGLTTKA